MATITEIAESNSGAFGARALVVSARALPADTVEIALDASSPDVSMCIRMYDAEGAQVAGATGSFAVSVQTLLNGLWETPQGSPISAAIPETIDWSPHTVRVRVVPSGLTGVTDWEVAVVQDRSGS